MTPMPVYEYVCAVCGASFEARRSMSASDTEVSCPQGHVDVRRKLSVFTSVGASAVPMSGGGGGGGGCCGGACGCGH